MVALNLQPVGTAAPRADRTERLAASFPKWTPVRSAAAPFRARVSATLRRNIHRPTDGRRLTKCWIIAGMGERDDFDPKEAVLAVSESRCSRPRPQLPAGPRPSLSGLSEQYLSMPTSHQTGNDALATLESYLRDRAALYRTFAELPGPNHRRRANDEAWAGTFEHWADACRDARAQIFDTTCAMSDTTPVPDVHARVPLCDGASPV